MSPSLVQRFQVLRETARDTGGQLDAATVDIAMGVCAELVGAHDVVDIRASGNGSIVVECGSGHTITVAPRAS